jgi:hypothetical protein
MRLLTVNTGSSPVRLGLYGRDSASLPHRGGPHGDRLFPEPGTEPGREAGQYATRLGRNLGKVHHRIGRNVK